MPTEIEILFNTDGNFIYLLFWTWLFLLVFPVPNEIIAITYGTLSSMSETSFYITIVILFFGVAIRQFTMYFLGRFIGRPIMEQVVKRLSLERDIQKANKILLKYKTLAIITCVFIPVFRSVVPLAYGISKLSVHRFIYLSLIGSFFWSLLFYILGYQFGDRLNTSTLMSVKWVLTITFFSLFVFVLLYMLQNLEKVKEWVTKKYSRKDM